VRSLAPLFAGRGWGEGLYPRARSAERAPHPPGFAALRRSTSPRKRGEVEQAARRRATQLNFARCRGARTPLGAKNRVRLNSNFVNRFKLIWVVQMDAQKYFTLPTTQIKLTTLAVPLPQEGRFAIVTDVGSGMRWTPWRRVDERRLRWTAKACGPDAPTLASSSRDYSANDGGKRARSPGRARNKP
jgi:hypothetical protein